MSESVSFNKIKPSQVEKHFNPTAAKIGAVWGKIKRTGGWTTNGYWAMPSEEELPVSEKVAHGNYTGSDANYIENHAKASDGGDQYYLTDQAITGIMYPIVILMSDAGNPPIWINAYYVAMLAKMAGGDDVTFFALPGKRPVVVKRGDVTICVIMPLDKKAPDVV